MTAQRMRPKKVKKTTTTNLEHFEAKNQITAQRARLHLMKKKIKFRTFWG